LLNQQGACEHKCTCTNGYPAKGAVLVQSIFILDRQADVLQLHDWQSALVCVQKRPWCGSMVAEGGVCLSTGARTADCGTVCERDQMHRRA
jgi:hypothetical protein